MEILRFLFEILGFKNMRQAYFIFKVLIKSFEPQRSLKMRIKVILIQLSEIHEAGRVEENCLHATKYNVKRIMYPYLPRSSHSNLISCESFVLNLFSTRASINCFEILPLCNHIMVSTTVRKLLSNSKFLGYEFTALTIVS